MNFQTIVHPMLLKEEDYPFNSKDYLYELKFDGTRALIYASPEDFHIYNRRGGEITSLYPELRSIQSLVKEKVIFDGEIVLISKGKPSFAKLQERSHLKDKLKIAWHMEHNPVCFIAFDLLFQTNSLLQVPLIRRKKKLEAYVDTEFFIKSKYVLEKGVELFQTVKKKNLEGIVAKKLDSFYSINSRTSEWVKIKNLQREQFWVGGYELNEETNVLKLYLGEYTNHKFGFVGKVVVSSRTRFAREVLKNPVRKRSPFDDYAGTLLTYITPNISCSVEYMERTKNNHLRQPVFRGKA